MTSSSTFRSIDAIAERTDSVSEAEGNVVVSPVTRAAAVRTRGGAARGAPRPGAAEPGRDAQGRCTRRAAAVSTLVAFGALLMVTSERPEPVPMVAWFAVIAALGVFAALRQNSAVDYGVVAVASFGTTVPTSVTGNYRLGDIRRLGLTMQPARPDADDGDSKEADADGALHRAGV